MGAPGAEFLAVLAPGVEPGAFAAGEGLVGDGEDLAHVLDVEGLEGAPLHVADVVVGVAAGDEVVAAPSLQLAGAAARESAQGAALLVVEIIPVLRGLDIGYGPLLGRGGQREQKEQEDEEVFHRWRQSYAFFGEMRKKSAFSFLISPVFRTFARK